MLLHQNLEAEEFAETLIREAGIEKSKTILEKLEVALEREVRKSIKKSFCLKCGEEMRTDEIGICARCV